jgi:subtilisin family serine protease
VFKNTTTAVIVLFLLVLAGAAGGHSSRVVVGPGVARAIARNGSAAVVVAFQAPRGLRTVQATASAVRSVESRVLSRAGRGLRVTDSWTDAFGVAGRIDSAALERLAADPDVGRVDLDVGGGAFDFQSNPLIRANLVQNDGFDGSGVTVAVLDSGIQENHPDLADSLVAEHCITPPNGCPNRAAQQNGPGSARDQNGHGTNVAGIITGNGTIAPIGVAPGAGIVAVRVLDAQGRFQDTADVISALQWVLDNAPSVRVVNMSLGTDELFPGNCDNAASFTMAFASIVHSLRQRGITVFASSGNDGSKTSMALPACLREVAAVGAVYDSNYGTNTVFCNDRTAADKVTCFTNSSSALDLLAPGAAITSTGTGSSTSTYFGTSQASPAAAATAAILLQANPSLTPARIVSTLRSTGKPVTDNRTGRTTPRVDAFAAVNAVHPLPPAPDTQRPAVKTFAATVGRARVARLRFRVWDDSGQATVAARLLRGARTVRRFSERSYANGSYAYTWRPKGARRTLSFCAVATDAAARRSPNSCSKVRVT